MLDLNRLALEGTGAVPANPRWDSDLHDVEANYLSGSGDFLVGLVSGRVVAMGGLVLNEGAVAEVKRLRVLPAVQGRGIGKALLLALEERARTMGAAAIYADTTTVQHGAQRLYQSTGYELVQRFDSDEFQVLRFRKRFPDTD